MEVTDIDPHHLYLSDTQQFVALPSNDGNIAMYIHIDTVSEVLEGLGVGGHVLDKAKADMMSAIVRLNNRSK
jgi:hypothetical protein